MNFLGILLILLSLALLMILCFKGVPIFFSALIAGVFLTLTAGLNPVEQMTTTYVAGLAGYVQSFFFIFILGAIYGKITDISGAADSIANGIVDKFGEKAIIPALLLACGIMAYGGISVFVCLFTVYPLMISMFKKGDISRTLIPVVYLSGAGTFACMMPGSPQIQNLMPGQILGTPATASLVPGFITGFLELALVFVFIIWWAKRSKNKGMHFEMTVKDEQVLKAKAGKEVPPFLLAILPLVILLVTLNVLKWSPEVALLSGCISGLICYVKYIDWKKIWPNLAEGFKDGTMPLLNTAAIVGFGGLVKVAPAFQTIIEKVTSMGGNPLVAAAIAVTVMSGVCASGSGGLGIALPIVKDAFGAVVNLEALHRLSTIACLTLDSLPNNGLLITTLNVSETTHKNAYFPVFITTVIVPFIATAFYIALCAVMGIA